MLPFLDAFLLVSQTVIIKVYEFTKSVMPIRVSVLLLPMLSSVIELSRVAIILLSNEILRGSVKCSFRQ